MNDSEGCVLNFLEDNVLTPEYWDYDVIGIRNYVISNSIGQLFICLTGIPLNIYIIVAITWKKYYRQSTYLLLLNLAVLDLLICAMPMLFNVVTRLRSHFSLGPTDFVHCYICKIGSVLLALYLTSPVNVALLSVDRFVFFKFPLRYDRIMSQRNMGLAIGGIWVLNIIVILPPLLGYGDTGLSPTCGRGFLSPSHIRHSFAYMMTTGLFQVFPVAVVLVTNIWIICIARKQIKKTWQTLGAVETGGVADTRRIKRKEAKRQFRLFQVFGCILLVNFITSVPIIVFILVLFITPDVPQGMLSFVLISLLSQATFHPLIEACLAPDLRKTAASCCPVPWKHLDSLSGGKLSGCLESTSAQLNKLSCSEQWTSALEK